ncbi:MAG: cytochrome c biogenesis protein CcsA [Actinomycetota bacterium]|nr:cytochrome c biogenesis protein CcsA [Actinomycetota bacterium]|tara:strand:- start:964 stop:1725 length:762 start_codon:yes stop_codon:yes gene_type:complete
MTQVLGNKHMTATPATRVLGVVALVAVLLMALLGLVVSPADVVQGQAVRMLYLHVPSIWIAYGAFVLTSLSSALFLVRSSRRPDGGRHYDRLAGSAAEVGVVFTGITLATGMLWGRVTWGTYWQWDARLTTTVLLFVTYLGYLALRRLPADPRTRGRRAAVMALISFVNVPIVHFSVDWWRTLHQKASLSVGRRPEITGEMYWTLLYSTLAVTIVAIWLIVHRYRVIRLEEMRDEEALEALIASRLKEDDVQA